MGADTTLKDDIAYMRGLAEAGRKGPVLGASILFSCGLIYSVAAVFSWLTHSGRLPVDLPWGLEWWAAAAVQIVTVIVMSRRLGGYKGPANPSSRLFGVVWSSMGFASSPSPCRLDFCIGALTSRWCGWRCRRS